MKSYIVYILALTITIASCKTKFYEAPAPGSESAGSASFTKYVAIGSSVTAGFADNALFTEAQASAYPNLLAQRFRDVNPALVFNQPDINSPNGWSSGTKGRSELAIPACSTVAVGGVAVAGESSVLPYTGDKTTLSNLAVPFLSATNLNTATVPAGTTSTSAS